jgi:uncharacterized protein YbaR (Trm112 family)
MISQELLDILRCPMDPARVARLEPADGALVCTRCRLRFPVREGIPCMLVEEAELPPGCGSADELPCRHDQPASAPPAPSATGTAP